MFFLLFLIPLLSFGAFAIDVARVAVVRNELQNAADAAALTGAAALMQSIDTGPNWAQAVSTANGAVALNASDGVKLSAGMVKAGYWNLAGSPAGMQATTITPGTYDAPAVQVTMTRATGVNGGAIPLLLGGLLGIDSVSGSATAVAAIAAPGAVASGGLFPIALDQCVYNQYWNLATNQPLVNPSTNLPYEFIVTNGQTYGMSCMAGQWTSFQSTANDVTTMTNLMATGNPSPFAIGDSIWLVPGAKTALYRSVPVGTTVVLPVVTQTSSKTYVAIVAFAAFHIDASVGGSAKYIQGHFVSGVKLTGVATGVGPYYGVYAPPRLAF
ncbi:MULTISPECIES: TadG family pilus assembly protein [Burkholderia]|uniref:TadG family pilus assembly protein n=1 Tax=Burkholderia TaxID=32008 RepID=UPI000A79FA04|nr:MULTISPECIES: TadG family pilus assembly protein [Burkholderia]